MKTIAPLILLLPVLVVADSGDRHPIRDNWTIQSSAQARQSGEVISAPGFQTRGWYRTTVPTTVFNALVRRGVYPDPNFGMNLRAVDGVSYPIAENFSNIPFPPGSPFQSSWWFRTEFQVPADYAGKTIWLNFDGINYRANVWLNGRRLAESGKMAGAWRLFEYDVSQAVKFGHPNSLALEIFPPEPDDLAITFVDWNPQPPDKNMGIWRDVYLSASGPVAIRFPYVAARLNLPSTDQAELTLSAELKNSSKRALAGVLKGTIEALEFAQPVRLGPGETKTIRFDPEKFPQLKIANPRLWWPARLGPQNRYTGSLRFEVEGKVSDQLPLQFGIRDVTSILDESNHRVFRINGRNILIRGAGYTFDMLLRSSPERQEAELNYVLDMNLNTIRLEGKLENDHFLELCDQKGILVQAGWCCCDHWEKWPDWKDEDHQISTQALRDQIRRLRTHPSVFDWMNGSDNPPPGEVEQKYISVLKDLDWHLPYQSSATQKPTTVSGETGMKMSGPYEYVAPSYWLLDRTRGGAHGFATEVGPGPSIPPVESLRLMLPEDHLWPIDSYWHLHTGGGPFQNLKVFTEAMSERYGAAANLEDYSRKAQVMAYEGHRAMFEAFGRNKYTSTGVIQWMLNSAWPSMIWHLYDYYLRPAGAYFGTKKACEPLHVQYSYDDASVVVVNSFYQSFAGMKVHASVYNLDMKEQYSKDIAVDVSPDSASRVFNIPELPDLSTTYFLQLRLDDSGGRQVSSNFYWLSTKQDVMDWDKSTWYYTPTKSFSDLRGLAALPAVDLKVTASSGLQGNDGITRVQLENPSRTLAFQVHLRVMKSAGTLEEDEVLPVLWQDNYFSLLPGEKREVNATWRAADVGKAPVSVRVDGWNVKPKQL